jgi:hypothetical protein
MRAQSMWSGACSRAAAMYPQPLSNQDSSVTPILPSVPPVAVLIGASHVELP